VTAEEKDFFEERAAIRQYQGGQSRVQAERGALEDLKRRNMLRLAKQPSNQVARE
jgi:hypothetical protein